MHLPAKRTSETEPECNKPQHSRPEASPLCRRQSTGRIAHFQQRAYPGNATDAADRCQRSVTHINETHFGFWSPLALFDVEVKDFPHLLFYGPSGAGKKTRVMAFLRENFGPGVEKIRIEHRSFKTPSNTSVELTMIASNHHIELNPSDAGIYDRLVVQEIIKELAQNQPLDNSGFKVVILQEVDRMTREAQAGLRRTMEKYMSACRLILCCTSTSKVIEPVRSRCLPVRVPSPTDAQIIDVLKKVAKKEGLALPDDLAQRIATQSGRNLRRALLSLEATKARQYPFPVDAKVELTDWELYINQMADEIFNEQSPKALLSVRAKLFELLTHCIPPEVILKTLVFQLLPRLDSALKHEVVETAAFFEHRLQGGSKPIYHLEAFVAKFMSIYRRFLIATVG